MTTADPEVQALLDLMRTSGRQPYEELGHERAREVLVLTRKTLQPDPPDVAEIRDTTMPGPGGPLALRIYRGNGAPTTNAPVLIFYHGGGWAIGDLDSHDQLCRQLANDAQCKVIAVDYRLAPENKFPAAVDDAIAALNWIARHADEFGIDVDRLAVGGDSAGGNLAAYACLHARDHGGPKLMYQLLIYPATDIGMSTSSYKRLNQGPAFNANTARWFRSLYLNGNEDFDDPRLSPLRVTNLTELPAALIITAGLDPLCDEGQLYGQKLVAAGVPVTFIHLPGQIHGFLMMGKMLAAAGSVISQSAAALKTAFAKN